jgi:hypothetical protein
VPGFTDTNVLANFLQVAVILVAVVALFFTAYFLWKRVSTIASDMNAPSKSVGEIHSKLDSNGWKEAASRFSESSQWKDACRALYMSALMLLDERSILKFVSTRTNYEYTYVLMSQSKQLAESFRALANIVELVWFGNKIAEANDYNACALALKQIDVVVSHLSRSEVNSSSGSLGDGKYSKPEPHANV